mgnify:CR=1 FL=1
MACDCGSRAVRLLHALGYKERTSAGGDELALSTSRGEMAMSIALLKKHHFRLTIRAILAMVTDGWISLQEVA